MNRHSNSTNVTHHHRHCDDCSSSNENEFYDEEHVRNVFKTIEISSVEETENEKRIRIERHEKKDGEEEEEVDDSRRRKEESSTFVKLVSHEKEEENDSSEETSPTTLSEWLDIAKVVLETIKTPWKVRNRTLKMLQELIEKIDKREFDDEESLNVVVNLLNVQLRDLRSAIIREACKTVQTLASTLTSAFSKGTETLLPTLVEQSACGNKVISRYALAAALAVTNASRPDGLVERCLTYVQTSKSWKVRCHAVQLASVVAEKYETANERSKKLQTIMLCAQSDAHADVRKAGKTCFGIYEMRFPEDAKAFLASVDRRAAGRLK